MSLFRNQWAYVLSVSKTINIYCIICLNYFVQGYTQISSVDPEGRNYLATVVSFLCSTNVYQMRAN